MQLDGSRALKGVAPAWDRKVLGRDDAAAHEGKGVVRVASVQASNKGACTVTGSETLDSVCTAAVPAPSAGSPGGRASMLQGAWSVRWAGHPRLCCVVPRCQTACSSRKWFRPSMLHGLRHISANAGAKVHRMRSTQPKQAGGCAQVCVPRCNNSGAAFMAAARQDLMPQRCCAWAITMQTGASGEPATHRSLVRRASLAQYAASTPTPHCCWTAYHRAVRDSSSLWNARDLKTSLRRGCRPGLHLVLRGSCVCSHPHIASSVPGLSTWARMVDVLTHTGVDKACS